MISTRRAAQKRKMDNNLYPKGKAVKRNERSTALENMPESPRPVVCVPALVRIERHDSKRIKIFGMQMWLI